MLVLIMSPIRQSTIAVIEVASGGPTRGMAVDSASRGIN